MTKSRARPHNRANQGACLQHIVTLLNPPGANCDFVREGQRVAEITSTPASTLIRKAKYDITIICHKAGYQDASYLNHSGAAGSTIGNIVLGGFIGWGIDSATGSDNYYDPAVNMTLAPAAAPSPPVSRAEPGAAPQS